MKICICATGPNLDSQVSSIFGRCPYFLIVDSEKTEDFEAVPNPGIQAGRGAGVGAGQMAASKGVTAVICGNFGPNAFSVLQMSGIKIYSGVLGLSVKQALAKYKEGELKELTPPPSPGRFGFGPGAGRRKGGGR